MPFNLEAERVVLGAIILGGDNGRNVLEAARQVLEPTDFYGKPLYKIFAAMMAVADAGAPVGAVTVAEELTRRDQLDGETPGALTGRALSEIAGLGEGLPRNRWGTGNRRCPPASAERRR